MASRKEYVAFILSQLAGAGGLASARPMMGEYVLYFRDKVFGGVYDDRLLVKPVPAACALLPEAELAEPYPGAKPMLLVEAVDDAALLCRLAAEMYPELPAPRRRKS